MINRGTGRATHTLESHTPRTGVFIARCLLPVALLLSLSTGIAGTTAPAGHHGDTVARALADKITPRVQSEVLVLGSWHTAAFTDIEPRHLEGTLKQLQRYAPTRIAAEVLPPDEIALLLELRDHSKAAQQLLGTFGKRIVENGRPMQEHLGIDRITAAQRVDALLDKAGPDMDADTRTELVGHMLAAYEHESAVLQWSYLTPEQRRSAKLPENIRAALDKQLASKGEHVILAMELARRHGLQRIHPIDSQYEAVRTLGFPEATVEDVFANPALAVWRERPQVQRYLALGKQSVESDDMLGLFRKINSRELLETDAGQWESWLTMKHSSGLDRFRYAMWEQRNARMASNILDVAASTRPERVLVVVGVSHKAYLDRELATKLSLKLRQFEEFDKPDSGRGTQ